MQRALVRREFWLAVGKLGLLVWAVGSIANILTLGFGALYIPETVDFIQVQMQQSGHISMTGAMGTALLMLLIAQLVTALLIAGIFYVNLKNNWKSLGLNDYRLRAVYLLLAMVSVVVIDVLFTLVVFHRLDFPGFGLLYFAMALIVPTLIKT